MGLSLPCITSIRGIFFPLQNHPTNRHNRFQICTKTIPRRDVRGCTDLHAVTSIRVVFFSTPNHPTNGRNRMYIWTKITPRIDVTGCTNLHPITLLHSWGEFLFHSKATARINVMDETNPTNRCSRVYKLTSYYVCSWGGFPLRNHPTSVILDANQNVPKHSNLFLRYPKSSQNAPEQSRPFPNAPQQVPMILKQNLEKRNEPTNETMKLVT